MHQNDALSVPDFSAATLCKAIVQASDPRGVTKTHGVPQEKDIIGTLRINKGHNKVMMFRTCFFQETPTCCCGY